MNTSYFRLLPVSIGLLFLQTGCNQAPDSPPIAAIKALNLKSGNVIACGPRDESFGLVGFENSCDGSLKKEFDMGVALLHSFEYDEAEKVFAKIIEAEPGCAMAYWGVAMSNDHTLWAPPTPAELEKGTKAIAIAKSLPKKSEREAAYINAMAAFYEDNKAADYATRYTRYETAMADLYRRFPSDPEAAIFYSLVLTGGAAPTDKTFAKQKKAVEILRNLYRDRPDHPGIIHYIIHSYDNPQLASLALPEARKYASIAPSSSHAQHMPSHIFTRLGLWQEDAKSNLDAMNSAKCYAESTGIKGHWDEELHSLDYLVYAYLQMGDNKLARQQVDYIRSMKLVWPVNAKVAYAFAAAPARYVLENRLWKEAAALDLQTLESPGLDWKLFPWQKSISVFAKTLGQIHTKDLPAALVGIREMETLRDTLKAQKDNYKANQVDIQVHSARAWHLFASGKNTEALALMQQAADMEDKTQKHAVTPGEVLPARELLGDMLLAMDKPAEALAAYEADLAEHPNRFNGLYAAARAASQAKLQAKSEEYYLKLIRSADSTGATRPELAMAKDAIAVK